MTTNDTTLTGPALSEAVALEVMGWHSHDGACFSWCDASETRHLRVAQDWQPHKWIDHAREVIAEMQRRGLMDNLVSSLMQSSRNCRGSLGEYFLTCPPDDICRAALAVVREQGEAGT